MFFVKVFIVLVGICCTTQADVITSIPIVGGVLGSLTNASKNVINTAVDTVQHAGSQILGLDLGPIIKDRISTLLENFKKLMLQPIDELGLPQLEPYIIGHVDIDISHEIGIFKGTMDNVVVTHLSEYNVENIGVKILNPLNLRPQISIKLHFKEVEVDGDYDIKAYVGDLFDIWGFGPYNLTMRGLEVEANTTVHINFIRKSIEIEDLSVDIKLLNMTSNFTNLMGGGSNGDLFNTVIGKIAPEAVETLWPEIKPGIEEQIKEVGNAKIVKIGFDKIIGILLPRSVTELGEELQMK